MVQTIFRESEHSGGWRRGVDVVCAYRVGDAKTEASIDERQRKRVCVWTIGLFILGLFILL